MDAAEELKRKLVEYAADTRDHKVSDDFVQLLLQVDGGMVVNNWVCQFLADILDVTVERPVVTETTALGAAYLAGLAVGLYPSLESLSDVWRCERRFEPKMPTAARTRLYVGWQDAVRRSRGAVAEMCG
jgi:glycerol kinase